ncbi:MAG: AsmA-like C-terminal domain-containing protein, partial [Desulforhabdus sp.]|nr:AsmA-like C-terminal domain-containing protein [Desulforhabdus sp.]
KDSESDGSISLDLKPKEFDLSFSGNLTKNTVDKLLQDNQMLAGWIKGDFSAHVFLEKYAASTAQGELEGQRLKIPQITGLDEIKSFSVNAAGKRLSIGSSTILWMENQVALGGTVDFSADGLRLDLNASVDGIEWQEIERILHRAKDNANRSEQLKDLRIQGAVKVHSGFFGIDRYTWKPFRADIKLVPTGVELSITRAEFCGLSTLGIVKTSGGNVEIDIKVGAQNQPLATTLDCLWGQKDLMQGNYSFDANITGRLIKDQFVNSMRGEFSFTAGDGRIYRFGLLDKIFSVLNFTEIFRGKLPNLDMEGFGYESFEMKGQIRDGEIDIEEAVLIGSSMEMVGRGNVNMVSKKLDLTVLVAPIKTLDVIISYIPLVNGILGRIVSIPVQVTGDLSNPTVIPLSPSAVGSELLGIMKKTIELPMRIIQPLMPDNQAPIEAGKEREEAREIK